MRFALLAFLTGLTSGYRLQIDVSSAKQSKEVPGRPVTVLAYWIRHGMSCSNVLREFTANGKMTQYSYADPSLTNCAINTAQSLGPQIKKAIQADNPDWEGPLLVFSSVLVRAMETAVYNFAEEEIYPIPWIAERGGTLDNMPLPWDEQEKKLSRLPNTQEHISRIMLDDSINPKDAPDRNNSLKDSYDTFRSEFPKILTLLLEKRGVHVEEGMHIPVVIVSHSNFMRTHLSCKGNEKPRNNEVWIKKYDLRLPNGPSEAFSERPMEKQDDCILPFESNKYPVYGGKGGKPCAEDIDRCSKTNPFMPWKSQGSCCNVQGVSLEMSERDNYS